MLNTDLKTTFGSHVYMKNSGLINDDYIAYKTKILNLCKINKREKMDDIPLVEPGPDDILSVEI